MGLIGLSIIAISVTAWLYAIATQTPDEWRELDRWERDGGTD